EPLEVRSDRIRLGGHSLIPPGPVSVQAAIVRVWRTCHASGRRPTRKVGFLRGRSWAAYARRRHKKRPGGLLRRAAPSRSERNVVIEVVVVPGVTFVLLRGFAAAEKVNRFGDDLAAIAVIALLVGPLGVVD